MPHYTHECSLLAVRITVTNCKTVNLAERGTVGKRACYALVERYLGLGGWNSDNGGHSDGGEGDQKGLELHRVIFGG
jgi:hypothetical protein